MSKGKAKLKKKRKPMSPETKRTLSNVFSSLISNQACVDGGRESPWWIAVIFFVLSLCLPLIPVMTSLNKGYGASFVASANYGTDRGLSITSQAFKDDGYRFVKDSDNIMHFYDENGNENDVHKDDIYQGYYNFRFFVSPLTGTRFTVLVEGLTKARYTIGTTTFAPADAKDEECYTPSFIALSPETMVMVIYKNQSVNKASSTYGNLNWVNTSNDELLARVLKSRQGSTDSKEVQVLENWKDIFNETYLQAKSMTLRNSTLLYAGIYLGLILFLGLMLFLLTRGKNNPFHTLNFFVCQKIAWWASFTPAVLGMILAFVFAGNMIGQMGFIVLLSLRVMWLSMRQLRPVY